MNARTLPLAHLLPSPAHHGILENGERLIRDNEPLINAHCFSESLAARTCAIGIVEIEHQFIRLGERHAVGLETG